jgi:hypothetical protein
MADDLWRMPMQELMLNSAQTRAGHYRLQATELREIAESQIDEKLRRQLLDLATKYSALANSVSRD